MLNRLPMRAPQYASAIFPEMQPELPAASPQANIMIRKLVGLSLHNHKVIDAGDSVHTRV